MKSHRSWIIAVVVSGLLVPWSAATQGGLWAQTASATHVIPAAEPVAALVDTRCDNHVCTKVRIDDGANPGNVLDTFPGRAAGDPLYWGWSKVWTNLTDGQGSTLDADLFDGKDSSFYLGATGKAVDADMLDGRDSAWFLPATGKAVDTDTLDGLDSSAFLPVFGQAVDADKLDGLDSSAFLPAVGKAVDADRLDGLDSTAFLSAVGKAVDSDKLDGLDSTAFLSVTGKAVDSDKLDGVDSLLYARRDRANDFTGDQTILGVLGIGTRTPGVPLDVVGRVRAGDVSWANGNLLSGDQGGAIELGNSLGVGTTPYVDFHRGVGMYEDYNVRVGNVGNGALAVLGAAGVAARLGIGTTTPGEALDVAGNAILRGDDGFDQGGETATLALGDAANAIQGINGVGLRVSAGGAPDAIVVRQGSGNIGIGTLDPQHRLHVAGDFRAAGGALVDGALGVGTLEPGSAKLAVLGGNVGLGTTAPGELLTLAPAGALGIEAPSPAVTSISTLADGGLPPATIHVYRVSAVNAEGGETLASAVAAIETSETELTVELAWSAVPFASLYRVYRSDERQETWTVFETDALRFVDEGRDGTPGVPPTIGTFHLVRVRPDGATTFLGGNVGLGTLSPDRLLDVAGTIRATGPVDLLSSLAVGREGAREALDVEGNSLLSGRMAIGGEDLGWAGLSVMSGGLGVGTAYPDGALHVVGDTFLDGNLNIRGSDLTLTGRGGGYGFGSGRALVDCGYDCYGGGLVMNYGNDFGRVTIDGWETSVLGNLGVGTSFPQTNFDVAGDSRLAGRTGLGTMPLGAARLSVAGTNFGFPTGDVSEVRMFSPATGGQLDLTYNANSFGQHFVGFTDASGTVGNWMLQVRHPDSATWLAPLTGGVGIGLAAGSSTTSKLDVLGDVRVRGPGNFDQLNERARVNLGDLNHYIAAQVNHGVAIGGLGTGDALTVKDFTGNVGIGTTAPIAKLHVQGTTFTSGELTAPTVRWGSNLLSQDAGGSIELGNSGLLGSTPYLDFHHGAGVASQDYNVRVRNTGNLQLAIEGAGSAAPKVGIGVTSPTQALDVEGSIAASGRGLFGTQVGIGTDTPTAALHVAGAGATRIERLSNCGFVFSHIDGALDCGPAITRSVPEVDVQQVLASLTDNILVKPSVAVPADGLPLVAYYDDGADRLRIAKCGDAACSEATSVYDPLGANAQIGALALAIVPAARSGGLGEVPVVAYYDTTLGDARIVACLRVDCSGVFPTDYLITTLDGGGSGGPNVGRDISIAVGMAGWPVVAYQDVTNGDLKATICGAPRCNTVNSAKVIDSVTSANVGQYSGVAVDSTTDAGAKANGLPVFSYYDATNANLMVAKCPTSLCDPDGAGGVVVRSIVDQNGDVGQYSSIAIHPTDAAKLPIVAYYDATFGDLKVVSCYDQACTPALPQNVGGTISVLDSKGDPGRHARITMGDQIGGTYRPVIGYYEASAQNAKMARCRLATCTPDSSNIVADVRTIDSAGNVGVSIAVGEGTDERPVVVFEDVTNTDIKVAKCADLTCSTNTFVNFLEHNVGQYAAAVVAPPGALPTGGEGRPLVAYYNERTGDLQLARCAASTCAGSPTLVTLDSTGIVGQYPSIAIGADNRPVLAYYDASNGNLKFARCATTTCTAGVTTRTIAGTVTALPDRDVGRYASIAINRDNLPVVAAYDATNKDIIVVKCGNVDCSASNTLASLDVNAGTDVGKHVRLAIDGENRPVLAYYDATNLDLKILRCGSIDCVTGVHTLVSPDTAGDVGSYISLGIAGDGEAMVTYYDATLGDLKLLNCNPGGSFCSSRVVSTLDSAGDVGKFSSLGFQTTGFPYVAYYDGTGKLLKLARCATAGCDQDTVFKVVDSGGDKGRFASLAVDATGLPIIASWDASLRQLRAVHVNLRYRFTEMELEQMKIGGSGALEWGAGLFKEVNAGKICYNCFSSGLDIVGAGTGSTGRKISLWDDVTVGTRLGVGIGQGVTPSSTLHVAGEIRQDSGDLLTGGLVKFAGGSQAFAWPTGVGQGMYADDAAFFAPVHNAATAVSDLRLILTDDYNDRFSVWGDTCGGGNCYDVNVAREAFRIQGNGVIYVPNRIGIGTDNPSAALSLSETGTIAIEKREGPTTFYAYTSGTSGGLFGTNYWVVVADFGGGILSKPSPETGLTASCSWFFCTRSFSFTWSAVAGATQYHLYRATSPGAAAGTLVATTAGTTWTDAGGGSAANIPRDTAHVRINKDGVTLAQGDVKVSAGEVSIQANSDWPVATLTVGGAIGHPHIEIGSDLVGSTQWAIIGCAATSCGPANSLRFYDKTAGRDVLNLHNSGDVQVNMGVLKVGSGGGDDGEICYGCYGATTYLSIVGKSGNVECTSNDWLGNCVGTGNFRTVKIWDNLVVHDDLTVQNSNTLGDVSEPVVGENLTAGDVVVMDGFTADGFLKVRKSDTAMSREVVGIISTDPSIRLAGLATETPLAISGIVPVKVIGPVARGDLLVTSNVSGFAVSCGSGQSCEGAILGKALEAFTGEQGLVKAMVLLG